jgi:sulfur relay (sulfurtransferase) DsrF/TusC family protein
MCIRDSLITEVKVIDSAELAALMEQQDVVLSF